MTPLFNQIMIEPIVKEQVLIADKKTLCEYGKVISIGEDVHKIKVGDVIAFTIWGLNSIEIDDKKYHFVQENEDFLLGKLEM